MIKLTQLFLLFVFTAAGVTIQAQPTAPPLTPEELVRLHAVKAWDIQFTYHFSDIRAGSDNVPDSVCHIAGRPIDYWTVSYNEDDQYVVKMTVAGKNGQSDCAPGSDSCLTKYQYPGSITNAIASLSRFEEVHLSSGCPGPGIHNLNQTYTISRDMVLDGVGGNRLGGNLEIDYSSNPPKTAGVFYTAPVDYYATSAYSGCIRSDTTTGVFSSRVYVDIWSSSDPNTGGGDTYVRIENGSFVVRGSSTVNQVFTAATTQMSCENSYQFPSGGAQRIIYREWVIRQHIDSMITVTRPAADMLFISGEADSIQWETDLTDSVRISYSLDSGMTYTEIADSIPASAHKCVWNVPDTLLSRFCRIKVVSMKDTTRFGVSEIYKMKGYVLTTFLGNGNYLAYDPAWDRWGFENDSLDVWLTSWYTRFNYSGTDPFTGRRYSQWQGGGGGSGTFSSATSSDFPDWPSFVKTFSVSACYVNTTLGIYSPTALARWASSKGAWNGSCFGIAISNAIAFRNSGAFGAMYPQYPFFVFPIQVISDTNTIPVVNELFSHQLGNPHLLLRRTVGLLKTPNQTLNDLKEMCSSDTASVRTLSILNNGPGGGGHAILAYKVKKNPTLASAYNVYVYDNSWSDSTNAHIVIDTTLNGGQGGWSYALWPGWGGSRWIYLRDPAINYLSNVTFPRVDPTNRFSPFILSDDELEISTVAGATVRILDGDGKITGYLDSLVLNEIPGSTPLVIENGSKTPPIGYSLPMASYSLELSNFKTQDSRAFFFTGNRSLIVERSDAQEHQTDQFYFDSSLSLDNQDTEAKVVHLTNIINETYQEKLFSMSSITMVAGDQLMMEPYGPEGAKLVSYGSQKTYELELEYSTDTGIARYRHGSVPLDANTAHVISPDWAVIGNGDPLIVLLDVGNDGIMDDTLTFENQVTDLRNEGRLTSPDRFNLSQNYPNPFNPTTSISYDLPVASHVSLTVYNTLGQEVAVLVDGVQEAGWHDAQLDATSWPAGVYYYQLRAGDYSEIKKMMLIK